MIFMLSFMEKPQTKDHKEKPKKADAPLTGV